MGSYFTQQVNFARALSAVCPNYIERLPRSRLVRASLRSALARRSLGLWRAKARQFFYVGGHSPAYFFAAGFFLWITCGKLVEKMLK
jgi:hypothetical protein